METLTVEIKNKNALSILRGLEKAGLLSLSKTKGSLPKHNTGKSVLTNRILNFKAGSPSSFGDAAAWQRQQREDRTLPFSDTHESY